MGARMIGLGIKKGLILRPALKESLNLKVSKGPEETTSRNKPFQKNLAWLKYLRVCPCFCQSSVKN